MTKYRIVRGGKSYDGKLWGIGATVEAETVREAVKKNTAEETKSARETFGGLVAPSKVTPIIAVYELVPVPESDWR